MKKLVLLLLTGILFISSCTSVIIKDMKDETGFVVYRIKGIGKVNSVQYYLSIVNGGKYTEREISFEGKIGLSIGDTLIFRKKNNFYQSFWSPFMVTYIEKGKDKGYLYHMKREVIPLFSYNRIHFYSRIKYKIGDTLILQKR